MFDKLKSLFVVTEETTSEAKPEQPTTDKPVQSEKSVINSTETSIKGNPSQVIFDKLLAVLNANNQQGFDYIEFKNSLKALEKMGMDEKTMYRSAFATAQTIGASVKGINDSIDFYKKILQKENNDFTETVNHQITSKLSDKRQEIEDFKKMIASKQKQIDDLKNEIKKHKESVESLVLKIETDKSQINKTKSDFDVTFNSIMQQIDSDAAKIKEYLV